MAYGTAILKHEQLAVMVTGALVKFQKLSERLVFHAEKTRAHLHEARHEQNLTWFGDAIA